MMVEEQTVHRWVAGYVTAWNSNARDDIVALFTDDARYYTEPYASPWDGRDEIVQKWLENKDEPGQTTFDYDVLAIAGDLALVKGDTDYEDPSRSYSNLWEITFAPDGRASRFIEWWMKKK